MMKNKKLVSFILAAAVGSTVGLAAGCGGNDKGEKLEKPVLTLTGNTITWNAVEHAEAYDVYEGSSVVSESQTACSYTITQTNPGTYEYTVVATTTAEGYKASDKSNKVEYTVPAGDTSTKLTGKIYLVGDSTVCSFSDSYYLPRYGYGTQLGNYINCDANQIVNLALSGRSSKSFLSEGNYTTLKNDIKAGDYLIIGFGHNDQKVDIYTNPNGDKDTEGSFQKSLYDNYVKVATDKGATPILCTPIVRANESNNYSGSSGHIVGQVATGKPGGDYAQAIRDLGTATGTTVVDLTAITKADYTALGYEKAIDYHAFTTAKWTDDTKTEMVRSGVDTTHTNKYGAKMNAYHFAQEIKKTSLGLAASIKADIVKPTYEEDYPASINKSFVPADYKPFDASKKSTIWNEMTDGWYGSVFGDLGGNDKVKKDNFVIEQTGEKSFKVGNTSGHGKITGSSEGIATIFKQIGSNANFEITAKVNVNTYNNANNQSGFGIMLRDDIYVDKNDKSILSNYVAAGCYGTSTSANVCYYRLKSALTNSSNTGKNIDTTETTTHTLSLKRSGTTVTVTFDSYTYTSVADFDLREVDSDYMYICLYATRGTVVTFSDVNYNYTGEAQA